MEPRRRPQGGTALQKSRGVNTWLRYGENAIRVFGSCYGAEHIQERVECLHALKEAHEEDERAFPAAYCIELFEELTASGRAGGGYVPC